MLSGTLLSAFCALVCVCCALPTPDERLPRARRFFNPLEASYYIRRPLPHLHTRRRRPQAKLRVLSASESRARSAVAQRMAHMLMRADVERLGGQLERPSSAASSGEEPCPLPRPRPLDVLMSHILRRPKKG